MIEPYYSHNGISIYHGDCLEVMAGLSVQSKREVYTVPFNIRMAAMTQTNNVVNRVCVIRVCKRSNRDDVMNIGFTKNMNLAASPTRVVVSLARRASQPAPILAIVCGVSAAPEMIAIPAISSTGALGRAKAESPRALVSGGNLGGFATRFTGEHNRGLGRRFRRNKTRPPRRLVTLGRANRDVFGPNLCWLAGEFSTANLASQHGIANFRRRAERIGALATTGSLSTVFQSPRISKVDFSALWTRIFYHYAIIARQWDDNK